MQEQSHKDEMRAALRGDFERLRARRGEGGVEAAGAAETVGEGESTCPPEPASAGPAAASRDTWLHRLLKAH